MRKEEHTALVEELLGALEEAEPGAEKVKVLTKFCDPEEFDVPFIKRECEAAGLPVTLVEVDRQMRNFEQAHIILETFRDVLRA